MCTLKLWTTLTRQASTFIRYITVISEYKLSKIPNLYIHKIKKVKINIFSFYLEYDTNNA